MVYEAQTVWLCMCQIARRLIKEEQSKLLVSESEYDMVLMARMAEKREGRENGLVVPVSS